MRSLGQASSNLMSSYEEGERRGKHTRRKDCMRPQGESGRPQATERGLRRKQTFILDF